MPITYVITAPHGRIYFEILYRNRTIVSIIMFDPDKNPRGQPVLYDDLALTERESILIAIINHLNDNAT